MKPAPDVNTRAVLLATENAERLGVTERYRAHLPDEVPDGEFDEIWSNPPIHIGKEALHELLLTWLPRLAPGGRAVMVVGKNLGADSLQRWLGEQGFPTSRIASAKGFACWRPGEPATRGAVLAGDGEVSVPLCRSTRSTGYSSSQPQQT